ncbi:MAG: hypothetical protein IPM98_09685 [Lewinellaceae bacterium]|nr:hypothetical protein [Lewinellaceae bacterium]
MWTMLEGFQHLTAEEMDTLVSTPVWITALIGSADGEIDHDERNWSDRLMRARTYSMPGLVSEYYRVVAEDFLGKLDRLMEVMPNDTDARSTELAEKIGTSNPILAKLDIELAATLYKSFAVLAKETAKASGGFLRIGSVSAAEHQWLHLPMLTPIIVQGENPNAVWEDEE